MSFTLHKNLLSKIDLGKLHLSRLLLEDNANYPWLILVPEIAGLKSPLDLKDDDAKVVWNEVKAVGEVLKKLFNPDQINIAALGNKTPQLHIHVIARSTNDPAWPGSTFEHPAKKPYGDQEKVEMIQKITSLLGEYV